MVNLWVNLDHRSKFYTDKVSDVFNDKKEKRKVECNHDENQKSLLILPFKCDYCSTHYFDVYETQGNVLCK